MLPSYPCPGTMGLWRSEGDPTPAYPASRKGTRPDRLSEWLVLSPYPAHTLISSCVEGRGWWISPALRPAAPMSAPRIGLPRQAQQRTQLCLSVIAYSCPHWEFSSFCGHIFWLLQRARFSRGLYQSLRSFQRVRVGVLAGTPTRPLAVCSGVAAPGGAQNPGLGGRALAVSSVSPHRPSVCR